MKVYTALYNSAIKIKSIYYLLVPNLFAVGSVLQVATCGTDNPIMVLAIGGMLALPMAIWSGDWISDANSNLGELTRLLAVFVVMIMYVTLLGMAAQLR